MADDASPTPVATGLPAADRHAARRRRVTFWGQIVLVALVVVPLLWGYVLRPLKYRYLIGRVESARTAVEERAAFRLAADWGRVFEVDRVDPRYVAAKGRAAPDALWIRIEWLNGKSVIHRLIDTNNLPILVNKKYSHSLGESLL